MPTDGPFLSSPVRSTGEGDHAKRGGRGDPNHGRVWPPPPPPTGGPPPPRFAQVRNPTAGSSGIRAVSTMIALMALLLAGPALAQESGWHYSPYPGEGDRAALGCAYESTPQIHTCIAVRCENDFSVALYIDSKRLGGDGGRWRLQI